MDASGSLFLGITAGHRCHMPEGGDGGWRGGSEGLGEQHRQAPSSRPWGARGSYLFLWFLAESKLSAYFYSSYKSHNS